MSTTLLTQNLLWGPAEETPESQRFLQHQLITYIGNKRSLLPIIEEAVVRIRSELGNRKIIAADLFSGSGSVSRMLKRHCSRIYANDLESYSDVISRCYLTNHNDIPWDKLEAARDHVLRSVSQRTVRDGIIRRLYSPKNEHCITPDDRCFYTIQNAERLDSAVNAIAEIDGSLRHFLLAPLLSEASVHTNTSGVFKGFYKDKETGIGRFGGSGENALERILAPVAINLPVTSRFACDAVVTRGDAEKVGRELPRVDVAYLDPPYNQHPYGSNYFMLNLLVNYREPEQTSRVSGIPMDWNRSAFNKRKQAELALRRVIEHVNAKYVIISYNSEGFISPDSLTGVLEKLGDYECVSTDHPTFRGCRNLYKRSKSVTEFVYILKKG